MFIRGREDIPLNDVGLDMLQSWFSGRKEPPIVKASNIGRLASLFTHAVKQGWIVENPVKRLEMPRIDHKPPGIHTPDDARRLLEKARCLRPELIGYIAPIYFGGLRPAESAQLLPEHIKPDVIEVTPESCKTRQRRFVPINDTLRVWLSVPGIKYGGEFAAITLRRKLRAVRDDLAPFPWPQDVLRHTFCSHSLPIHGAAKTAEMAGHSETVLFAHYRERVTMLAARAFWAILPIQ